MTHYTDSEDDDDAKYALDFEDDLHSDRIGFLAPRAELEEPVTPLVQQVSTVSADTKNAVHAVDFRWSEWKGMVGEFESLYVALINDWLKDEDRYIFQLERCPTTGTLHYQGYCGLKTRKRAKTLAVQLNELFWGISIRPCSAAGKMALQKYCMKKETHVLGPWADRKIPKQAWLRINLWPWQQYLLTILIGEPDDRTIIWVHDMQGKNGKSLFCKYLYGKHKAVCASWGSTKHLLQQVIENMGHSIYLFDLTRRKPKDWSGDDIYAAMEQIKNGLVTSQMWHGKTDAMDPPHVVVFANQLPVLSHMTIDRWRIMTLNHRGLYENGICVAPPPQLPGVAPLSVNPTANAAHVTANSCKAPD